MHQLKFFTLVCLSVIFAGPSAFAADLGEWKIEITPRLKAKKEVQQPVEPTTQTYRFAQAEEGTAQPTLPPLPEINETNALPTITPRLKPQNTATTQGPSYSDIYQSIPFNRAEYLANPSYRHETTLSIMLGQPVITNGPKTVEPRVQPAVQYLPWSRATFGGSYLNGGNFGPYYGPYRYGF